MIGRRPAPVAAAPAPATPAGSCVACRRADTTREARVLDDGSVAQACVDPADCRRHWPADDRRAA